MNEQHWADSLRNHSQTPRPQAWQRLQQRLEATKTDKIFVEKLHNLEQAPRPQAWQRLQGRLPAATRRPLGWRWAAAAAVLLLAGWGGYRLSLPEAPLPARLETARLQTESPIETPLKPAPESLPEKQQSVAVAAAPPEAVTVKSAFLKKEKTTAEVRPAAGPAGPGPLVALRPLPTARLEPTETAAIRLPEVQPVAEKEQVFVVKVTEPQPQQTEATAPAREKKFFGRLAAGLRNVQEGNWEDRLLYTSPSPRD